MTDRTQGRPLSTPSRGWSSRRWLSIAGWTALALFLILLLSSAWLGPDIFYHLFLGRRIVETGVAQPTDNLIAQQPTFVNMYWLFQLVCLGCYSAGGVVGLNILFMAVWGGTLLFWLRTAGLLRVPALGLPVTLGAILVLQNRFEPRPEILSYCFLSLQVLWLSSWRFERGLSWRRLALFGLVQMLWTNMHGYFVLGPMLVGALLLSLLFRRRHRETVAVAGLLGVTLLASLASPLGIRSWVGVYHLWRFLQQMGSGILEFAPPTGLFLQVWTVKLFWLYWGGTAALLVWLLVRRRLRLFDLLLAVPALYLSATSARNIPLPLLLAAPVYGRCCAGLISSGRTSGRSRVRSAWRERAALAVGALAILLTLGLSVWVVRGGFHHSLRSESTFGIGLPVHAYPVQFHDYLDAHPFAGKLLNNAADGGYLEFHFPDLRLYMDSRYTDARLVTEYQASLLEPVAFQRLHARHRFDGVLLKIVDSGPLVLALMADPAWRLVYADLHRVFLLRADSEQAQTLPDRVPRIFQGEDLSQRVNGMAAIQWTTLLIRLDDRGLLLAALRQLSAAPAIPSYVIMYALQYGLQRADEEVLATGVEMAPRLLALEEVNRAAVERLLRAAADHSSR